ncbi:hypothetical protein HDU96_000267 [Phlyctochytrium bullatum]|nr:hypothetical protein HDU96_000267 [Phlyctochytrium bullatum]
MLSVNNDKENTPYAAGKRIGSTPGLFIKTGKATVAKGLTVKNVNFGTLPETPVAATAKAKAVGSIKPKGLRDITNATPAPNKTAAEKFGQTGLNEKTSLRKQVLKAEKAVDFALHKDSERKPAINAVEKPLTRKVTEIPIPAAERKSRIPELIGKKKFPGARSTQASKPAKLKSAEDEIEYMAPRGPEPDFSCKVLDKVDVSFSRSSGPGGQNVNKVNTKVEIRFEPSKAEWLPEEIRRRLAEDFRNKLTKTGEFIIMSDRHRTQSKNLSDCIEKLHAIIQEAIKSEMPKETSPETIERIKEL